MPSNSKTNPRRVRVAQSYSPSLSRGSNNISSNRGSSSSSSSNNRYSSDMQQPILTSSDTAATTTQSNILLPKYAPAPRTVTPTNSASNNYPSIAFSPTSTTTTSSSASSRYNNNNNNISSSSNNNRNTSSTSGSSWEDYDEGLFGAASRKAKQRQQQQQQQQAINNGVGSSDRLQHRNNKANSSLNRPAYRTYNNNNNNSDNQVEDDDEMPMDELMGSRNKNSNNSRNRNNRQSNATRNIASSNSNFNTSSGRKAPLTSSRQTAAGAAGSAPGGGIPVGGGSSSNSRSFGTSAIQNHRPPVVNTISDKSTGDDVSSLGGVEEQSNGIGKIITALKHNSFNHRPNSLSVEERLLWDAIQKTIGATRQEHTVKRQALENQLQDRTLDVDRLVRNEVELERQLAMTKTKLTDVQKVAASQGGYSPGNRDSGSVSSSASVASANNNNSTSSNNNNNNSLKVRLSQLEQKIQQHETEMKEKDSEHEAEVRAIQRVLADVSTDREDTEQEFIDKVENLTNQVGSLEQQVKTLEDEKQSTLEKGRTTDEKNAKKTAAGVLSERSGMVAKLQDEKNTLDAEKTILEGEKANLQNQIKTLQEEKDDLSTQNANLQKERDDAVEAVKTMEEENAQKVEEEKSRGLQATTPGTSVTSAETTTGSISSEDAKKLKKLEEEAQEFRAALKTVNTEKVAAKRDVDKKSRRLISLERDLKAAKTQVTKLEEDSSKASEETQIATARIQELEQQIADSKKRNEELSNELEEKEKQIKKAIKQKLPLPTLPTPPPTPPRSGSSGSFDNDSVSSEEVETLQRSLADTVSSLENAKKIIASLESANGSLALDHRAKVKAKDEELTTVQNESAERKRRLDSLATELRDLQRKQGNISRAEKQSRAQFMRMKALSVHLEKSISGLQSASVVHEVSASAGQPDPANVDQISEILSDTLLAVTTTMEMADQCIDEFEDQSVAITEMDVSSEVGRTLDAIIRTDREAASKDLKDELDQKKLAVRRLEDAMRKQSEEMKRLRAELDKRSTGGVGETVQLKAEIRSLREQCATNMDVLAKKERELSVLRSSLSVDEDDGGYISDDAEEDDDDDEAESTMSPNLNQYGQAEAEALATILSNGRAIDLPTRTREMEALKNDLLRAAGEKEKACRDLQAERESLANAKMIISSLEKANKSMMEDLRSRLQDSNTAIQSLLDKSMEHEKKANTFKEELEQVKTEKGEAEQMYLSQLKKFKDESKIYSLRIASKDRELSDLREQHSTNASTEEKKEDVEED